MKPKEFELKVIQVIKTFRKLKDEKQIVFAKVLGMEECNYSKIENGHKAISLCQLKLLAEHLKVSYHQILLLAEGPEIVNSKFNPLSKILVEYVLLLETRGEAKGFTREELEHLISKIKEYYK